MISTQDMQFNEVLLQIRSSYKHRESTGKEKGICVKNPRRDLKVSISILNKIKSNVLLEARTSIGKHVVGHFILTSEFRNISITPELFACLFVKE